MGLVYSFCFGNHRENSRAADYKIDEDVVIVEAPKTYSWDKRQTIDPREFTFDGLQNQALTKGPGSIAGQQFIIQNCKGCTISLLDYSATVTIDDCIDCHILIGPCKGSVFIRDCIDCRLIVACQQYRTRDCKNMDTFLLCQTQPIIESSVQMRFGCLQLNYDHLQEHLDAAKLSVFNNNWSKIHDFTPAENNPNYSYLPEISQPLEIVQMKVPEVGDLHNLRCDNETSLVPLTLGKRPRPSKEACFCLLFSNKGDSIQDTRKRCRMMIRHVTQKEECRLVSTAEVRMTPLDVERITNVKTIYNEFTGQGPVIAMEWCGTAAANECRQFSRANNCQDTAYITEGQQAVLQLKEFYNYVDMQHGV